MKLLRCLLVAVFCLIPFRSLAKPTQLIQLSPPFKGSLLYIPNDGKPHRGVVLLHGSEGGSLPYALLEAQFLAGHGFAVLAYCWYNCSKNPITQPIDPLENVELRNTVEAIKWLKSSSYVQGEKLALLGWSRGAEQALILGTLPEIGRLVDAIAVHTPSDTIVSGISWAGSDRRCWICTTFDLACFRTSDDPKTWDWTRIRWNAACGPMPKPPDEAPAWLLDGKALPIGKTIEIEAFGKPVFITVGDRDELWDYKKSVRIEERLKQAKRPVELYVFPGEYHSFSNPNENRRRQLLLDFLDRVL